MQKPVDYTQRPIFRMVHFDNLKHLLRNGMSTQSHKSADPGYINIGDSNLIRQRQDYPIKILPPGGNLGDCVPFYFWGHSPMLLNIKTGHRGVTQRDQADIVFLVCSIESIIANCPGQWCFTDKHAKDRFACFYNSPKDLCNVDWDTVYLQYWYNNEVDLDRQQRKEAEFLVKGYVPIACIKELVVFNEKRKGQVETMVAQLGLDIPVKVDTKRQLYYP